MQILRPAVWTSKPETSSRLRGRIERILDWSSVSGFREGKTQPNGEAILKTYRRNLGFTTLSITQLCITRRLEHLFTKYVTKDGMAAQALEFLIYTAARTSEVIGAEWDKINLDQGVWTIPDWRTKTGKEHRVHCQTDP